MNLDILFLGKLFPKEKESEIKSKIKTGMQDAANALQWNIIDGLEENDCGRIKILNYLPVNSYPNGFTDKSIPGFVFSHTDKYESVDLNIGCTNRAIIKHILNIYPFKKEIEKWVNLDIGLKKVLLVYSASPMFLSLAKFAKQLNNQIEICCVIADLPEFFSASDLSGVRKIYNTYQTKKCALLYKYVDRFVLLTEGMSERLKISVPYIVMEGIAPESHDFNETEISLVFKNEKFIFYSGTLNYKFGIGELLEAFNLINDNDIKLVICGFGQAEERIKLSMESDSRILFLGRIDRSDAISLQRKATVLVNPRQNNEEFTKYSFPSKTMEYLASGVPLVAYKLDGIPDEYDKYINYVPDNSSEALALTLSELLKISDDERTQKGLEAKDFVLKNKNRKVQAKKILDFIK